jgi:hypothetical protein
MHRAWFALFAVLVVVIVQLRLELCPLNYGIFVLSFDVPVTRASYIVIWVLLPKVK